MKILSWNVNGLRSVLKKGFKEWLLKEDADMICLQETKAHAGQIPEEIKSINNYYSYFTEPERKGYSGVCVFTKVKPLEVLSSIGSEVFDKEGRLLQLNFKKFTLLNVYFPNGNMSEKRLNYKLAFYEAFLKHIKKISRKNPNIIICGDVNTAHKEIDLARPKQNEAFSGFLPVERKWIDKFIDFGFLDTLRMFDKSSGLYTWWDFKTRSRERNVGWRIDYFFINKKLKNNLKDAFIESQVYGSDHCPIGIKITL